MLTTNPTIRTHQLSNEVSPNNITYKRDPDTYSVNLYIDFVETLQDFGEYIDLTMFNEKNEKIFSDIRAKNIYRDHVIVFDRKYDIISWILRFNKDNIKNK